jgi:putative hydrolase of the HAD superfamily
MPTLVRAEAALGDWLATRAPRTGALFADAPRRLALRQEVLEQHPEYMHDLSFQRLRALALGLQRHGEDPALAEPAFEVFFAARQQVDLYPQAAEVLQRLSGRYPLLAVSNGNADVVRVGLGAYFSGSVSARDAGVAKPDPRIFHAAAAHLGCAPPRPSPVRRKPMIERDGASPRGGTSAPSSPSPPPQCPRRRARLAQAPGAP